MKSSTIFLTGFMTSGKSTLGPILANVLGYSFIDLDDEIVDDEECSIDEIFAKKGEGYFREIESKKLRELGRINKCILSLGGGAVINNSNVEFIKKQGLLIYLKSSPDVIYNRIKNKLDRPLFKDLVEKKSPREDFIKRISGMLKSREKYYKQAHVTVNTDDHNIGRTIDFLANKIKKMLNEENKS